MCWCTPNMRTPCCGTEACHAAACKAGPGRGLQPDEVCPFCERSPMLSAAVAKVDPRAAPFATWEGRALEAERSNVALKRTIQSMGRKFNELVRSRSNRALRERVHQLEHVVARQAEQLGAAWEDKPLPEDKAIYEAFPTRSGSHEAYAEAMRLVGARRSKGALVALVNWLLVERDEAASRARASIARYLFHIASMQVGGILGPQSREIVDFCAHWVENRLDEKWAAEMAARDEARRQP